MMPSNEAWGEKKVDPTWHWFTFSAGNCCKIKESYLIGWNCQRPNREKVTMELVPTWLLLHTLREAFHYWSLAVGIWPFCHKWIIEVKHWGWMRPLWTWSCNLMVLSVVEIIDLCRTFKIFPTSANHYGWFDYIDGTVSFYAQGHSDAFW